MNNLQKNFEIMGNAGSDTAIRVNNLTKAYKLYPSGNCRLKEALHPFRKKYHQDFYALKNVSFEVKKGEVLGIIGKNGSGKSTLLKIISGVLQPSSGEVHTHGKISALLELGSGFNPEYTGIDNIYFYGSIMGFTKEEMEEKIDDILAFADIGDFIHQPLKIYSSGMTARLAFSVSTEINPDILIVDEILAVGDAIFQRKCYARIEKMFNDGKSVILVSHNRDSIVSLCKNAILLDHGKLLLEDNAGEVVRQYEKLCNKKFLATATNDDELKKIADFSRDEDILQSIDKAEEIFFDSSLVEDEIVFYKKSNVSFESFGLFDKDGHKVNILKVGHTYIVKVIFTFEESLNDFMFALRIKNIKGLVMSWIGYPFEKNSYLSLKKNDHLNIELEFDCNLLEGIYSIDAGLQSFKETGLYHHIGIANVYMFKIKNNPKINYFGPVNLNFHEVE
jgi:homopolymeric O-antigen transport system ATP-binding protein